MNRLYTSGDFSSSCSSDTDDGSSSEDEANEKNHCKKRLTEKSDSNGCLRKSTSQNIIFKLQNREVSAQHPSKKMCANMHIIEFKVKIWPANISNLIDSTS